MMYEEDDEMEASPEVDFDVAGEGSTDGSADMTVDGQDAWLDAPAREYPVIIDPPVVITATDAKDCSIYTGMPYGRCDLSNMKLESTASPSTTTRRGLIDFALPPDLQQGAVVSSATLKLFAEQVSTQLSVAVHRVGQGTGVTQQSYGWTQCVTWFLRSSTSASPCGWGGDTFKWKKSDGTVTSGGVFPDTPADTQTISSTSLGLRQWNVTGVVQNWVNGPAAGGYEQNGLLLKIPSETSAKSVIFTASDAGLVPSTQLPSLAVNYSQRIQIQNLTTGPAFTTWGYDVKELSKATQLAGDYPLAEKLFKSPTEVDPATGQIIDPKRLGMDVIRIPIFAWLHVDGGFKSLPATSTLYDDTYGDVVAAVHNAQRAKPGVTIFASLKLKGAGFDGLSLPDWAAPPYEAQNEVEPDDRVGVREDMEQKVIPAKYEALLRDYLAYMHTQQISIDVLGIDNEPNNNEAGINMQVHDQIIDAIKASCPVTTPLPFDCPKRYIGPESTGPASEELPVDAPHPVTWLNTRWSTTDFRDSVDVAGTHYYSKFRDDDYVAKLADFKRAASGPTGAVAMPLWDSEFHWNDLDENPTSVGDELTNAERALQAAFDHFDAGFEAIVWWGLNHPGLSTDTAEMQGSLVRSTTDAFPIKASSDLANRETVHFRAFRSGSAVVLWLVNATNVERARKVVLASTTLGSTAPATVTQWTENQDVDHQVPRDQELVLPPHSVTYMHIPNAY